jgi:rhodanese-related sulfurtransferase
MIDGFSASAKSPVGKPAGLHRLVLESWVVGGFGLLLALAANALSPRGLALDRDYFPPQTATAPLQSPAPAPAPTPQPAPVADSPPTHDFRTVTRDQVEAMTRDAKFVTRKWLLIDARRPELHHQGHIPGSLQFDRFQPGQNLATVLPACLAAESIVIYCNGGACEDSHFAARMLRDFGVPTDRIAIYEGGFFEWQSNASSKSPPAP